jgi:hypothetical protein
LRTEDFECYEAAKMNEETRVIMSIFVDHSNHQWVVRDREGNWWSIPSTDNAWEHRQPFFPTEESELEPVPGHYRVLLGLPELQIQGTS